jgi:hypothetical protein
MDPNSEILKQLTRIADATSRQQNSQWLDWVRTIASFVAGLLTAYLSSLVQGRVSEIREESKLRRIVYTELARCFLDLDVVVHDQVKPNGDSILKGQRYSTFQNQCNYDGESYMKNNPAIFYRIKEGEILKWMYFWFHKLDGNLTTPPKFGLTEMKAPLGFFSDRYRENPIIKRNLKKFVSKGDFRYIAESTKRYKHASTLEESVDSGVLQAIPRPITEPPPMT